MLGNSLFWCAVTVIGVMLVFFAGKVNKRINELRELDELFKRPHTKALRLRGHRKRNKKGAQRYEKVAAATIAIAPFF